MTRLDWSQAPSQIRYESGVDRGVLYPASGPGVVWNGLVSVEESSVGGDVNSFYFDGIKYLDVTDPKNFQATITAFSAPPEFLPSMGHLSVIPGFVLTRQPRSRFGLAYRTNIGEGEYKLHIVYNALATPTQRSYSTKSDAPAAENFSWQIDATPPLASGYRPSAHYSLDSTKTDPNTLKTVEDILYGTALSAPRLPSVDELVDIIGSWDPKLIVPDSSHPQGVLTSAVASYPLDISSTNAITLYFDLVLNPTDGGGHILIEHGPNTNNVNGFFMLSESEFGVPNALEFNSRASDTTGYDVATCPRPSVGDTHKVVWVMDRTKTPCHQVYIDGVKQVMTPDSVNSNTQQGVNFGNDNLCLMARSDGSVQAHGSISHPLDSYLYAMNDKEVLALDDGVSKLTNGIGDLTPTRKPGFYRSFPSSRLAKTATDGLYRLE